MENSQSLSLNCLLWHTSWLLFSKTRSETLRVSKWSFNQLKVTEPWKHSTKSYRRVFSGCYMACHHVIYYIWAQLFKECRTTLSNGYIGIQRMIVNKIYCVIHRIEIYLVDSVLHLRTTVAYCLDFFYLEPVVSSQASVVFLDNFPSH